MGFGIKDQGRRLEEVIFKLSLEKWIERSQVHRGKERFQEHRRLCSKVQSQEHEVFWEIKALWYA